MYDIKKQLQEEQKKLKSANSKEDLNALFKGRTMIIMDGSDWNDEICEFVEMTGGKERKSWLMKLKTRFGTFLELKPSEVMITVQKILATEKESKVITDKWKKDLENGLNP